MNIPASITRTYRRIPASTRRLWNPGKGSNSHIALKAIEGASGWKAWALFFHYAVPHFMMKDGIPWWLDG